MPICRQAQKLNKNKKGDIFVALSAHLKSLVS